MRRFRALRINETFLAQAAAVSAFIMVALVVSGLGHPVRAGQRPTFEGVHNVGCQTVSCRPNGL
jgi:hypothetical protein